MSESQLTARAKLWSVLLYHCNWLDELARETEIDAAIGAVIDATLSAVEAEARRRAEEAIKRADRFPGQPQPVAYHDGRAAAFEALADWCRQQREGQ